MKTNCGMEKLINEYQVMDRLDGIKLHSSLESLLLPGVIETNGCHFLSSLVPSDFDIREALKSSFDRTELRMLYQPYPH